MQDRAVLDRAADGLAPPPGVGREHERRRRLAVMRRWATGMLVVVSGLWLLLVLAQPSGDGAGYAQAALEASMVGALADWFAVTALFRHPLGLPIPHTAVVVERKDQFGRTLAEFFRENFLSGASVAHRMRTSNAVVRAATWGADHDNATSLARHVLRHTGDVLDASGDDLARYAVREARVLAADAPIARLSATALRAAVAGSVLDDVIDAGCDLGQRALVDHRADLEASFIRDRPWWLPELVQRRVFEHLVERTSGTLEEVTADRTHPIRLGMRTRFVELADRIERDPALAERLEACKTSVIHDERVGDAFAEFFAGATTRFRAEARTPGSEVEHRLVGAIQHFAARVLEEPDLQVRLERSVEGAVNQLTSVLGEDIDALVTGTIAHWDAARTADQLELLLGPDLQYIRINGTVVGGLAGLLIHTVAQAIG